MFKALHQRSDLIRGRVQREMTAIDDVTGHFGTSQW
jgi:hypothetical protein